MVALGLLGVLGAVALTVGALALAGDDLGSVVQPELSTPDPRLSPSASPEASPSRSASPSPRSGQGSDDSGGSGGDDSSGSGESGGGSGSDGDLERIRF